jgi:hypothetical protein
MLFLLISPARKPRLLALALERISLVGAATWKNQTGEGEPCMARMAGDVSEITTLLKQYHGEEIWRRAAIYAHLSHLQKIECFNVYGTNLYF